MSKSMRRGPPPTLWRPGFISVSQEHGRDNPWRYGWHLLHCPRRLQGVQDLRARPWGCAWEDHEADWGHCDSRRNKGIGLALKSCTPCRRLGQWKRCQPYLHGYSRPRSWLKDSPCWLTEINPTLSPGRHSVCGGPLHMDFDILSKCLWEISFRFLACVGNLGYIL